MPMDFERIAPEEAGIPSSEILAYMQELRKERFCLHDLLIFRRGKLVYEAYWKPMNPDVMHRQYSCSKSYVSVAVGAAIGDGLLQLDDRLIDYFPERASDDLHPWVAAVTIRDMLRMSTCFTYGAYYSPSAPDWADTWFGAKPSHEPGRVFNYDTAATTMLCMLIRRVTGMEFFDYLRTKVFDKIGFDPEHKTFCVETPCGHTWGGSGVICTAYDMARFALFCMNYGNWNGEQLVPEWYMREATSYQIDIQLDQSEQVNNGYGYQFWTLPDGGFSFNGMGCQYAVCMPKQDLLLITHGYEELNCTAKSAIFNGFFNHILPWTDAPIAVDPDANARLRAFTDALAMSMPSGKLENPAAASISGKTYCFAENELGWKKATVVFEADGGRLDYENASGAHSLRFAFGKQAQQAFPETDYSGRRIGTPLGRGYNCYTSAAWGERTADGNVSDSLSLLCQVCDFYLAQLRIILSFKENTLTIRMRKNAEWFLQDYTGFATGKCD